jgi:hypothetical protein
MFEPVINMVCYLLFKCDLDRKIVKKTVYREKQPAKKFTGFPAAGPTLAARP